MVRSRAWLTVLSVAALVVPAGGIAYLGAVSYRDERGAVSAQNESQRQAALGVAARISGQIEAALDGVDQAVAVGGRPDAALARYWFWLDPAGHLRVPRPAPAPTPAFELGGSLERGASCAGGRLEDCVRELATRRSRIARLAAAERAEATGNLGEARRQLAPLTGFADTGPAALLGLARVLGRLDDPRAADALDQLERRFGDRGFEGVPVRLVVAVLRARDAPAVAAIARDVLAGRYAGEGAALPPVLGVLDQLRRRLAPGDVGKAELGQAELGKAELGRIDAAIAALRAEARAAAGLAEDLPELSRAATAAWRGRPASREPARTLIYRRRADGGVIGVAVDAPMLEAAAGDTLTSIAGGRLRVLPSGASPGPGLRMIAQVPLGAALPHLGVAIVNPLAAPDPLDAVIRERARRHVLYTSALVVALALGLLAMIRGAARARELARLKSDFVSTVSHELKTPLTSIRMFAEMLEQGVAQGDPAKMARYHGVIVQESQRLGLLIANLLDYAQIEKGTRRYTWARQGVAELARHAAATFETLRDPERAGRNPLVIDVSPEAMAAEIEVDRDVVIGAVMNLLANAAKYGGAARPIELAIAADAAGASIAVRDHGPGIPPAEQARIFREFYRAPEAYHSGVEGTGLGLALVKRHIEALGGRVDVASVVGEGATFTIRLPRAAGSERSTA
ncbi:MAG TPA: HAMP domain-containing sensor histidine kinase [Kofleriaceae bacterium]